jgi:hypothetical protein
MAQLVVVVEVLVAERNAHHALHQQGFYRMFCVGRVTALVKQAAGQDKHAVGGPNSSAPASDVIARRQTTPPPRGFRRVQIPAPSRYTLWASGTSSAQR